MSLEAPHPAINYVRPRCGRCAHDGTNCVYNVTHGGGGSAPTIFIDETPRLGSDTAARTAQRFPHLGSIISGSSSFAQSSQSNDSSHAWEYNPNKSAERDAGYLFRSAQTKSRYLSPTFFALNRAPTSEIENLARSNGNTGNARQPVTGQQGHSESNASSISRNDEPSAAAGDIFHKSPLPASPSETGRPTDVGSMFREIVAELPSTSQQDALIWAYMAGTHTVTPLFDRTAFLRQTKELRDSLDDSPHAAYLHFLALFTSVLFAGAVVMEPSHLNDTFADLSSAIWIPSLYHLAIRAIRLSGFPQNSSVHTLAAYIIVNTIWLRDENTLECCAFVGLSFRVGQMLGLHRDPSTFPDISPIDCQVRRQLWFALVAIDAQVAFASGLPPLIDRHAYKFSPGGFTSDLALQGSESLVGSQDSMVGLFVTGRHHFYSGASEFLALLHSNSITAADLDMVLKITTSLQTELHTRRQRIRELDAGLTLWVIDGLPRPGEVGYQPDSDPQFASFAMTVLTMLAAKPYAIMYGPLHKAQLLNSIPDLRATTIKHCQQYLLYFLTLTQYSGFQPWHWRWPGQHQPLHSVMALISNLDEFPTDRQPAETRRLVDLAFYLCRDDVYGRIVADDGFAQPNGLWVSEHRAAWRLARTARDRVWEKAGLDPTVLVCPRWADEIVFDDIELPQVPKLDGFHSDGGLTQSGGASFEDDWMQYLYSRQLALGE